MAITHTILVSRGNQKKKEKNDNESPLKRLCLFKLYRKKRIFFIAFLSRATRAPQTHTFLIEYFFSACLSEGEDTQKVSIFLVVEP